METEEFKLVNDCLNGNGKSYEILVDKYQKVIFRLAIKFVKDFDDAEEITQSVFVKAYENLDDGSYYVIAKEEFMIGKKTT